MSSNLRIYFFVGLLYCLAFFLIRCARLRDPQMSRDSQVIGVGRFRKVGEVGGGGA